MAIKQITAAVEIISRLPRYREIVRVLYKFGFGDMLKLVSLEGTLDLKDAKADTDAAIAKRSAAERFRLALEELGPTFVKFGQILSSRRDLIDETLFTELHKLQASVPPFSGKEAVKIVEEQLGRPIEELFKEFEETPLASASLAQVHRAVARGGEVYAIKVQRPGIAKVIEDDLAILVDIARFLDTHVESIAVLNPVGVVEEFSKTISAEQDFTIEARNMERFSAQFKANKTIRVPACFPALSTSKVLTMEHLRGYEVDDLEALRKHHIDPVKLAERISKLIYLQMFRHGFFHGDPHPGNMTALKGDIVALYDYGMMGRLSVTFREDIASMILGLSEKDHKMVTRSLIGMSDENTVDNLDELENDVAAFSDEHLDRPLKDLRLGFVLNRLLDVLMKHKMRMKAEFYLGIKALSQVEAIGQMLNPNLNFVLVGKPYATEVLEKKSDVRQLLKHAVTALSVSMDSLKDMPLEIKDMYQKFKSGKLSIPVEHKLNPEGYEPLRQTLNHTANRLAHAMVLSALLILAGLLFVAHVPPLWHGIPVFALVAVGVAAMFWFRHWIAVHRHGGY